MESAETPVVSNILSLPQELFVDIGSCLDEQDVRNLEMAGKRFYDVLSRPSRIGLCSGELDLTSWLTAEASRWLQKRIMRYTLIICEVRSKSSLEGRADEGIYDMLPPAFPAMLAACASSTEVSLTAYSGCGDGDKFLATATDSIGPGVGLELSSFWADLKHHLTILTLTIYLGEGKVQYLRTLGMFTALRELCIGCHEYAIGASYDSYSPYHDLLGEELALKLPHLVSLRFQAFRRVKLVLSCPKLTDARFVRSDSMHIAFENASLPTLVLKHCQKVTVATSSPKEQLQNMERLEVNDCSEEGSFIMEEIGFMMKHLKSLVYTEFPAVHMPNKFPQNLWKVVLCPLDWRSDLPEGLKDLRKLEIFYFNTRCESWKMMMPLAELLPMVGLKSLALATHAYSAKDIREGNFIPVEEFRRKRRE